MAGIPGLDLLDRRIMYELDLNARLSASALAKKLRRSKETVNFRINRLLREGYLKGFYAVFNTSKLGWFYYKVYLKFKAMPLAREREIVEYIKNQERVAYLASMDGRYSCIFLVMCRDADDMAGVLYPLMKLYGEEIQEKEIVTLLTAHRLNQKFLYVGGEQANRYYPVEMGNYELDETEERILKMLATRARMPLAEIAKNAGVDPKVVKYRIRKLEREGIILGYVTAPGFDRLGLHFIQINITLRDPTAKNAIMGYFDSTNKCLFTLEYLGGYDLGVEIHVRDDEELQAIIGGFREKFFKQYENYDISTVTREHLVIWGPFAEKKSESR